MRLLKKFSRVIVLSLALALTVPSAVPYAPVAEASAAAIKLNVTKKTIQAGKSVTLKVSGTKKSVTWSSSKKSVATVSKAGKVTGKSAGTATITAKTSGKTLKCKITVKGNTNKYVAKAPFDAVQAKLGKYTFAIPEDWTFETTKNGSSDIMMLLPKDADKTKGSANISIVSTKNASSVQKNFNALKEYVEATLSEEAVTNLLSNQFGSEIKLSKFKFKSVDINLGKATVISYNCELGGKKVSQAIYDIFANGYTVEVTISDNGEGVTPDVYEVGEYIVNSLVYK